MSGELTSLRQRIEPSFAEVQIHDVATLAAASPATSGLIGIELPSGIKLTVDSQVDADALSRVMSVLSR